MRIEDIIDIEQNGLRLGELEGKSQNICPFVGAGVSKGCGLYGWDDLLKELTGLYLSEDYEALIKRRDKLQIVDDLIAKVDNNESTIMREVCDLIGKRTVKITKIPKILIEKFSNLVITTNYDTILEDIMKDTKGGDILLPFMESQSISAIQDKTPCVLKIHGSIKETSSMVLAEKQYDQAYGKKGRIDLNKIIPRALEQIFSGNRVLFVGCSLEEDRTLDVLKKVIKKNNRISHYAIMELPDKDEEKRDLRCRLGGLGIQPIYYPKGKYEYIEAILDKIVGDEKKTL